MAELSCTITGGLGSERHNHDLAYREGLDHTNTANCPEAIIELVPYEKDYKTQINELMKPFIDEYNAIVEARLEAAWERYRSGQVKSKPKKKDFKTMDYDYFTAHKDDTIINPHTKKVEPIPIFRSWIIGIGDKDDRSAGRISEEQARQIFREFIKEFREKFPHLHILGATIHLDEEGFYHMHLDYKPVMAMEFSKGLQCTTSQDTILETMGYKAEQSIINGRDKAPIMFNALRNQMYYMMEDSMAAAGHRLQYGVSKVKQPDADSGHNKSLDVWQSEQDAVRTLQHQKNLALDAIASDHVTPEGLGEALNAVQQIGVTMEKINKSPCYRKDKTKGIVEYRLLDQLGSFVQRLMDAITQVFAHLNRLIDKFHDVKNRAEIAEAQVEQLRPMAGKYTEATKRAVTAEAEVERQQQFMRQFEVNGTSLDQLYQAQGAPERDHEK